MASKNLNYAILNKRMIPTYVRCHIYVASATIVAHLILEKKSKAALSFISDIRNKFPPTNTGSKKNYALSMAKCYAAMQKNELAERYYLDMLNFSELQAKEDVGGNYIYPANKEIGWFYLSAGNLQKAEKHLNTAFKEWTPVNSPNRLVFKSAYMFKLDSSYGRYLLAIQHLQRIQLNKDSIFTATKSKQIEELQIVYQTEQQKSDIKNLQNNEKMQQIKLQQAENTKNLIIAVAGMLLLLLGVIYNRYLLKQKSNRLLQAQREEIAAVNESLNNLVIEKEWLLKEVHHRVKNNLQTVVSLLELQSENLHDEALSAIQDSQSRIYAMSLIHQKLYQTDNVASINMQPYLLELTTTYRQFITRIEKLVSTYK
jgi:two-component sensor histidine kinase